MLCSAYPWWFRPPWFQVGPAPKVPNICQGMNVLAKPDQAVGPSMASHPSYVHVLPQQVLFCRGSPYLQVKVMELHASNVQRLSNWKHMKWAYLTCKICRMRVHLSCCKSLCSVILWCCVYCASLLQPTMDLRLLVVYLCIGHFQFQWSNDDSTFELRNSERSLNWTCIELRGYWLNVRQLVPVCKESIV